MTYSCRFCDAEFNTIAELWAHEEEEMELLLAEEVVLQDGAVTREFDMEAWLNG